MLDSPYFGPCRFIRYQTSGNEMRCHVADKYADSALFRTRSSYGVTLIPLLLTPYFGQQRFIVKCNVSIYGEPLSLLRIMRRGPHGGAGLTSSSTQLTSDGTRQSGETQKRRVEAWLIKVNPGNGPHLGQEKKVGRIKFMYFGFRHLIFRTVLIEGAGLIVLIS